MKIMVKNEIVPMLPFSEALCPPLSQRLPLNAILMANMELSWCTCSWRKETTPGWLPGSKQTMVATLYHGVSHYAIPYPCTPNHTFTFVVGEGADGGNGPMPLHSPSPLPPWPTLSHVSDKESPKTGGRSNLNA